jgi:tRNA modification GTPase
LRDGLVFAVTGLPNVGKSSLVNALAGRDVAIVAPGAGTTRDVLETRIVLGGVPVTLLDTAGLRETTDPVEAEGVRRARARVATADLVIDVRDHAEAAARVAPTGRVIVVANKADLGGAAQQAEIAVSALTGTGLQQLRAMLEAEAVRLAGAEGPPTMTRARHRAALARAAESLTAADRATLAELRGEDLRTALREIGRITGQVGADQVLDAVFSQFCIGK